MIVEYNSGICQSTKAPEDAISKQNTTVEYVRKKAPEDAINKLYFLSFAVSFGHNSFI